VFAYTLEAGGIRAKKFVREEIEKNPLRTPDPGAARKMEKLVLKMKRQGDSVGGIVEVVVRNPPAGLGDPVFDKLEADIAKALMSIGAIKGFEVGNGFGAARLTGSRNNDPMYLDRKTGRVRTRTNNAGGIAGGISNGEDIVVRIAVKPPSSIRKKQETVTTDGKAAVISVEGRHDPCICPRVVPVAESMVALTIIDHLMRQRLLASRSKLRNLRDTIDLIDRNLLLLLAERQGLVRQIGAVKRKSGKGVRDRRRERSVLLTQRSGARALGLDEDMIEKIFLDVFGLARASQKPIVGR